MSNFLERDFCVFDEVVVTGERDDWEKKTGARRC
jgi:hypothetical protein